MLTRIIIRNFKRIADADIELGKSVVFVGPNNSGKTSALQAIALWEKGLKAWVEKRGFDERELKRSGVTINRNDLIALSVPSAELLWRDLHVRAGRRDPGSAPHMENILIEVIAEGVNSGKTWTFGLEFDYANKESFYCRPARKPGSEDEHYPMPSEEIATEIRVAYLPPMSGLASIEPKLELGRINVLIGEGQTAQILRNLCRRVFEENREAWDGICVHIRELFGVELMPPDYIAVRGEVSMSYRERSGSVLDLSSSGRGLQQTLLLLTYISAHPGTIILLDEPDAHLEVLRQRQIYHLITAIADARGCQIIAASHSEVIMEEAAERDRVIAFIGKPHVINNRGSQLIKSLNEVGFEDYYLAEERRWVLYLEGSTDLSILKTFAGKLGHEAAEYLAVPFVKYVGNNVPKGALNHFYAIQEAYPALTGVAIFDRLDEGKLRDSEILRMRMWSKRELENYFCARDILLAWASGPSTEYLFGRAEADTRLHVMDECITELEQALQVTGKAGPWSDDIKATDDFLNPLFRNYLKRMGLPESTIRKGSYFELADLLSADRIDKEIIESLDLIALVAKKANPIPS
jgi:ABC-type lipoprotein export system ATPase subunit